MSAPLLIVPPLLKTSSGPLAGPSQLLGVARDAGHALRIVDLNNDWLHAFPIGPSRPGPTGDHARPVGGFREAERGWAQVCQAMLDPHGRHEATSDWTTLPGSHAQISEAAHRLADSFIGARWAERLGRARPPFVGVSVLWSGQVLAAIALSVIARRKWPGVPVVWGGAHVTALAPEIASDSRYGDHIDGFVAGYAEQTFRLMLDGDPLAAPGVFTAGAGLAAPALADDATVPAFTQLAHYGRPWLTLPTQVGRGCAYGECSFCTYPAIEGVYRPLALDALATVVRHAARQGAHVSLKDAMVPAARLDAVADLVAGRVPWSASTRLVPRLGRERLSALVRSGLRTLELGVESLDAQTLAQLQKRQPPSLVAAWLADAEGLDLWLVLNTMSGFPGQSEAEAHAERGRLAALLTQHPGARVQIEHNRLEIERRSPLAKRAAERGLELDDPYPWSSVLPWRERGAREEVA